MKYSKIKSKALLIFFIFLLFDAINISAQTKPTEYVNPFIGTDGHGHTYPGASLPHGLVQLSPDTDIEGWDWCSGYHYSDSTLMGFSHTHLSGTGIGDYGDILFMPTTGPLKTIPGSKDDPDSGYRSRFSHKTETAKPGYYSVFLKDYGIKAELTAAERAGFHKYTFPESDNANIIIDLNHGIQDKTTDAEVKIINDKTIEGYRRSTGWAKDECVYFYAEFSKPFKSFGIAEKNKIYDNRSSAKGNDLKAFVHYTTSKEEAVLIKVGISFVSIEGAKKNVQTEIPGWDFEKIENLADKKWNEALSSISVETSSKDNKATFYTALYHSLLTPNLFSDVDGKFMGMDKKVHSIQGNHDMYTVFSLWDTFRAEHPLFTLIEPKHDLDMVRSLITKYKNGGLLPVWELAANETNTMIGYHSIPVIVDAYFKGIRDFNVEEAYQAMKKSAMQNHFGLKYYKEMGYIPSDLESESVSKTLEYAYDDWCIAQMAKALGKEKDYKYFIDRAKFFTNVFDPSTSLMRAKKNGRWYEPFDPYSVSGNYTEANAWQYSFFVPQDVDGLMKLMGGNKNFISKLDELFNANPQTTGRVQSDITGMIGQYAQGNEPSHHMAYLYNYAGEPWKSQDIVHRIVTTLYTDKNDGLCGNDDCGQMSAWYVFSSLGFYPVCPGDATYIIGTPLFDKAAINVGKGKTFTVTANNLSSKNFYIQSAILNGKEYPYTYITHAEIIKGGNLVFEMGPNPSDWGKDISSRPQSKIEFPFVAVPYLTSGERVFKDTVRVGISSIQEPAKIYYTINGRDPRIIHKVYTDPIIIDKTSQLKAVCYKDGIYSKVMMSSFNMIPEGVSIKLNTEYSHAYSGGGAMGLIDGVKGTSNFHTDAWQGYEGDNLDAVIDLGKIKKISSINASFLQNTGSWIFYPAEIDYYISTDGKNFTKVYETKNVDDIEHSSPGVKGFEKKLNEVKAQYIRVLAKNVGVCPDWHVAAGGKAWLFVDEISVK
ncbi:MAG: GH92 family glycosyl hydrolase [Ignavibacteriaceae bacterium]